MKKLSFGIIFGGPTCNGPELAFVGRKRVNWFQKTRTEIEGKRQPVVRQIEISAFPGDALIQPLCPSFLIESKSPPESVLTQHRAERESV